MKVLIAFFLLGVDQIAVAQEKNYGDELKEAHYRYLRPKKM